MKLAVVMSRFPAVTETFILRELVELERQGEEVELVPLLRDPVSVLHDDAAPWDARAHYTPFLDGDILRANLRVFASAPLRYVGALLALLFGARSSWNAFAGTLGIFPKSVRNGQLLRARGVAHIHAHYATHPATAAYVMSRVHTRAQRPIPYSLTLHAHDIFISQAGLARKLHHAAFVRCISAFNVDYLKKHLARRPIPDARFEVIHCGISPGRYHHDPEAGEPGVDRVARILCIASHRPYKGLTHLIDAVRLLRETKLDVRCDVIGEGVLRPTLERQIAAAGLGAHFALVGTRTEAEVVNELARCDVFALPSIVAPDGQMEGIPVVLMEALAAGVPTVATAISGIPELVRDGETGTLVDPADPEALANAIATILSDYNSAIDRARAGRALVESEFEIVENVRRLRDRISRPGFSA